MKEKTILFGIAVFLWVIFYIPPVSAEVIISEFSIGKYIGGKALRTNGDDFIEIYNTGDVCVPLDGWKLRKRIQSGTESSIREIGKGKAIMPNDFFLWVSNEADTEYQKLANITSSATLTGNSSVALLDNNNSIKDSVVFGGNHTNPFTSSNSILNPGDGLSHTRDLSSLEWENAGTIPSPTGSSISVNNNNDLDGDGCPDPPPIIYDASVRLNELLPNPSGDEKINEFIELYNTSNETIDLSSWIIKDASASGKYVFPSNTKIQSKSFLVVYRSTFDFALNNNTPNETVSLLDPNQEEKDKISYTKTKENVSLNYTPSGLRGGMPTPGAENQLNNLPETNKKVPKKGYRGTPVMFNAKGKDRDGDTLKYVWNFGDGHKSYKEKTSHKYEENGVYTVTLTTTDGSDDVTETFALKIESYPHPKIRITSLTPNPEGKDTDNEWLMLENKGKGNVNLKNFGIATGWKNLTNHPIREDFIIKSGQKIKLTRANSLFTLPNQKGKIELRAPDGKVLQKIKYKLKKSISENAVYRKKKGERWNLEETIEEPVDTNTEITPPPTEEEIKEESQIEEPAPAPDMNTQTEEENNEENPDFQETEKPEGSVLGASVIAETPSVVYDNTIAIPQKQKYSIISLLRQAFSNINSSLNNIFNISQN